MAKNDKLALKGEWAKVARYLNEIGKPEYDPLLPEEEVEVAKKARSGDGEAKAALAKHNLRFVVSVAGGYQGQGLPLEDLIAEGNMGLIDAAERFDVTRGFKFISYAVWRIDAAILLALANNSRVVRLPQNRLGAIGKIGHVLESLQKELGRDPTLDEIATRMEMSPSDVAEEMGRAPKNISIDSFGRDKKGDESDDLTLLGKLESNAYASPEANPFKESLNLDVRTALASLDTGRKGEALQVKILTLYFGLEGDRPLTLLEIGEIVEKTRERVRQIKVKALQRLRHAVRVEPLRTHLG